MRQAVYGHCGGESLFVEASCTRVSVVVLLFCECCCLLFVLMLWFSSLC